MIMVLLEKVNFFYYKMDNVQTEYILNKINTHTQNLNNHRIFYRNLLIISICLLVVSIIFLYSIYGIVKSEDRSRTFKNLTYIDTGVIGGSIVILMIILFYRFNKESNQQINSINGAIKQMGNDIKDARAKAADEKDKAERIKKAAQDMNYSLKNLERNRAIIESS